MLHKELANMVSWVALQVHGCIKQVQTEQKHARRGWWQRNGAEVELRRHLWYLPFLPANGCSRGDAKTSFRMFLSSHTRSAIVPSVDVQACVDVMMFYVDNYCL